MATQIILKSTTGNTNPTLSYGELGICYKNGIEKLFAKNSLNEIFAFNDWNKIFNRPTSFDGFGITGGTLTGGLTGTSATFSSLISSSINATNLTSNYLPKHTSTGFSNSLLYDSGTGIGLGTTSVGSWKMVVQSQYPFQIKNSSSTSVFEFYADLKENRYLNGLSIVGYLQDLVINTSSSTYDLLLQPSGGTVGIGTSNPSTSYKLDVNGSVRVGSSTTNGLTITNGSQSVTLTVDSNGVLKLDNSSSGASFYATGEVSAYGSGTGSTGGGGGSSYNRLDLWGDYSVDKAGYVLSAYLGNDLNSRLSAIEGNGATSITTIGAGNAVTSVSKTGNLITFNKDITFLTQNQNITLSGDVAGTGNTAITTSIAASTVTSKVLTGYTVGTNAAVAATDTILLAFGKIQAQINARPGTVTSIGMTLPTGLQVSPTAITSAGTFAITFASGYSIPTNAKQSQWDTAYTNNHTHTNYSVLTGITSTSINNWDSAYFDTFSATSSNTSNTLVKRDGSGNFSANTITASLSGNASTATKLSSTRTFQLTGDVTGTITSDLSTGATISTTIAANSVALGTDTTGNYAGSISVSGSGLSLSGSAGEGTNYTITSNATSNNVPSTIVYRDSSGDFVAGSIIAEESFNYSTNAYTTYNSITKTIDFVFN